VSVRIDIVGEVEKIDLVKLVYELEPVAKNATIRELHIVRDDQ
jgi:hypothetical protein